MLFFGTIVTALVCILTITNFISLKRSWPLDYENVHFCPVLIIVTWYQALKIPHALVDPYVLEKKSSTYKFKWKMQFYCYSPVDTLLTSLLHWMSKIHIYYGHLLVHAYVNFTQMHVLHFINFCSQHSELLQSWKDRNKRLFNLV